MKKYYGVIPAFYACYDEVGEIDSNRTKIFAKYLADKGVQGLYVCGSSGECIYQNVDERKKTLEAVMEAVKGKLRIIAHVACNNTKDSIELARHAESVGVDAIASIPPIYFHLPDYAIRDYWNAISNAAPHTDFIIYNIPQLAGVALSVPLLKEMLKNPNVAAVKNSSMPTMDIQVFKMHGGENFTVFNGPDEQFVAGLIIGADGGIGGTYAVMPELFLKAYACVRNGDIQTATGLQMDINRIIFKMCEAKGNLYAVMKAILKLREGLELGSVRSPLPALYPEDSKIVTESAEMITAAIKKYC